MKRDKLKKQDLNEMAIRSFFIQSCWNFDRMQNIGFAFCILPVLKEISDNDATFKRGIKRHLEFFNSHPYMSVFAIGAIAGMEIEKGDEKALTEEEIDSFKCCLVGPLGAIGDSFFWASLRPTATLLALGLALMGYIWAPLVFILFYNIPHLFFRFRGIEDGYKLQSKVICRLKRYRFFVQAGVLKDIGIIVAGFIIALMTISQGTLNLFRTGFWGIALLNFILVIIFASFLHYGIKPLKMIMLLIVLSLLAGYLGFLG